MSKRKRDAAVEPALNGDSRTAKLPRALSKAPKKEHEEPTKVQIVTGSYERVLHGILATVSHPSVNSQTASAQFVDSFLFNAHESAIRCLALSPPSDASSTDSPKVTLATGGTDERVNLYSLSASPAPENEKAPLVPLLGGNKILENPKNREIGSLLHHSSSITALYFPTRSKLISAAEDNTIAVTRSRDWTVISTIKAPQPKVQGRPSGDTAPPGSAPSGVNDFAVHPSMKLMLSVGKGEKCMRLWNLVTGKKAGVLSFERELLQSVREGKYSSGEGRKIEWSPNGQEFAVAFERGVIIFGAVSIVNRNVRIFLTAVKDSKPRLRVLPLPLTKIHQIRYFTAKSDESDIPFIAVSTEDGRIMFYSIQPEPTASEPKDNKPDISDATVIAQIGGKTVDLTTRIKDFEILLQSSAGHQPEDYLIVTASSDGTVRLWMLTLESLTHSGKKPAKERDPGAQEDKSLADVILQVGTLLGSYETGNRITCLKAFTMLPSTEDEDQEAATESESSFGGFSETSSSEEEEADVDEAEEGNTRVNDKP
ncbi:MAG: hypothetical protein Q9160_007780 [Pyrenula sp. 1 TL-2023]